MLTLTQHVSFEVPFLNAISEHYSWHIFLKSRLNPNWEILENSSRKTQPSLTVTENDFEEALTDTVAESDGFVAPNNDYVTTFAPMKTVVDTDGDKFINARKRPFHDTDQV